MTDEPPSDIVAEQSVLGAMLLSATARASVIGAITGGDFYKPAHGTIFDTICTLDARGAPADPVTVVAELHAQKELQRVGGPVYLHTLVSAVPTAANVGYYVQIVRDRAVLRRLANAGTKIRQLALEGGGEVDAIVQSAAAEFEQVHAAAPATARVSTADEVLGHLVPALDLPPAPSATGPGWGWLDVDDVMNPLTPGKLVVIGARPAVGKSLVLGCMAASVAFEQHQAALLHTLEMSRGEVMQRLLARQSMVDLARIIRHELGDLDRVRVARAVAEMRGKSLVIDETRGLTPLALRASIRRQKPRPAVVFVDYLQLMRKGGRVENRLQEVSSIARELKEIAGTEEACVVTAAQLNRNAFGRLPRMADLRESGEIEQSADDVILLDRPDEKELRGEISFIVEKHRQGASGMTVRLADQSHFARFSDLARH